MTNSSDNWQEIASSERCAPVATRRTWFSSGSLTGRAFWAPAIAIASVCYWVVIAAVVNPAQYADSIEQFNWAHSLELGYWKHPPLTTWLMRAAIAVAGPIPLNSYALAALAYSGAAFFTWKIASMLMRPRAAALAVLLWSLHHGYSWRAQVYNHNSVLVLMASAFVWASLRAARSQQRKDWLLAGALAGLALLTKYQAAVAILAVLFGLWRTGALRERSAKRHLATASSLAALVFLPHLAWAWQHSLPTLQYLRQSAPVLGESARAISWFKFLAVQASLHGSMLLVAAATALWPSRLPQASEADSAASAAVRSSGSWLLALVGVPLALLSALILLGGITPQKFWGLQTLQFFPLLLAHQIERHRPGWRWVAPVVLYAAVNAAGGAYYAAESADPQALRKLHSMDRIWPAKALAAAVLSDWRAVSPCPLKYVVGPAFPAGLVSVYSGLYPAVLEDADWGKSPWLADEDVGAAGAIVITKPLRGDAPPAHSQHRMEVPAKQSEGGRAFVYWEVIAPQDPRCAQAKLP